MRRGGGVRGSGKKEAVKDVRRGLGVECHAEQSGKRIMTLGKAEAANVRGGREEEEEERRERQQFVQQCQARQEGRSGRCQTRLVAGRMGKVSTPNYTFILGLKSFPCDACVRTGSGG